MKVLYVCNEYPPLVSGGIGIFVKTIAQELISRDVQVFIHCFHNSYKRSELEVINGVVIYRMSISQIRLPILDGIRNRILQSFSVRKIVNKFSIDFVESYDWSGPIILHPRVPLVLRLHGGHLAHSYYENVHGDRLVGFFERFALRIPDHFIAVSKHIKELSIKAYNIRKPVDVIYNFYDPKLFSPLIGTERDSSLILFVGKFHKRKGVYEMFDRLNELIKVKPEYRFKFIGGYTLHDKVSILSKLDPDIVSRIEFVGRVPHNELPYYYSSAAFTLVPSRAEAFGLIAIEAMACGSVVIMSDGHVGNEIINNGVNGFLIDFREQNSLLKLFQHLNIVDIDFQKSMHDSVQSFSIRQIVDKNLQFYYNTLKL